jgi:hypothetical protein
MMLFNNRFKKTAIALFSTAIILMPTAGMAQSSNRFIQQLAAQLYRIARSAAGRDYDLVTVKSGRLRRREGESLSVTMSRGNRYAIVGVCDEDCNDIDLRLYDENDNLIDSDTSSDDKPVVVVSPRWSGEYRLRVTMARCSANPCYYGVGLFRRN